RRAVLAERTAGRAALGLARACRQRVHQLPEAERRALCALRIGLAERRDVVVPGAAVEDHDVGRQLGAVPLQEHAVLIRRVRREGGQRDADETVPVLLPQQPLESHAIALVQPHAEAERARITDADDAQLARRLLDWRNVAAQAEAVLAGLA